MKKCVILDDYQDVALHSADWSQIADRVSVSSERSFLADADAVVERIGDAEIVCIMRERTPFPAAVLDRLPNLGLIVTSGMRNAAIDLAAAARNDIIVSGTATSGSPPLELAWGLIIGLARQIVSENTNLRAGGPWQDSVGVDLKGRQLGIVGLGKIGTAMSTVAKAFGMKVVAWSPNLTDERVATAGVERAASKEALLESSDFVTLHLVLSPSTRNIIGDAELRLMKPGAFLINTARAALVDQAALIAVLKEKAIAGAGLDVFETEPLPVDDPFRTLTNVLATPHLGYVSQDNYRTFFGEGIKDIEAWLAGVPIRTLG